jgi:hypothetical protein
MIYFLYFRYCFISIYSVFVVVRHWILRVPAFLIHNTEQNAKAVTQAILCVSILLPWFYSCTFKSIFNATLLNCVTASVV